MIPTAAPAIDHDRLRRVDRFLDDLVDAGQLPGWAWSLVTADGVAHDAWGGLRDIGRHLPVEPDTLFRIYSMTKPITAAAAMLLFERGLVQLTDPLEEYLPEFASTPVYDGGDGERMRARPRTRPLTLGHALTHTSGLTYGFHRSHPVDAGYRSAGHDVEAPPGRSLAESCRTWASMPLLFEPGTAWNYSVGMDVVGRVIEVVSGRPLGEFADAELFGPLGMTDTGFHVVESARERLAVVYRHRDGELAPDHRIGRSVLLAQSGHYGGGGLVSTLADYGRFAAMLLRTGTTCDGRRLLAPETVRFMLRNHLPAGRDIASFGRPMAGELGFGGVGQALGATVVLEPATWHLSSPGEYAWGGIAGTYFWCSPALGTAAIFMLQVAPATAVPIRGRLHQLVHQSLIIR